jgi:hypothetical protein
MAPEGTVGGLEDGGIMRFLLVNDDATAAELREAIVHLRAKQLRSCIPSTYEEIGADIDELIDMLAVTR